MRGEAGSELQEVRSCWICRTGQWNFLSLKLLYDRLTQVTFHVWDADGLFWILHAAHDFVTGVVKLFTWCRFDCVRPTRCVISLVVKMTH